ncbi:hypothetical protein GbCGDNIH6_8254 [Granulibacter bethesdensis]|nr:hypothetical protein GbCGDNIH6_8254 [Granulibacter bethesdensis]
MVSHVGPTFDASVAPDLVPRQGAALNLAHIGQENSGCPIAGAEG